MTVRDRLGEIPAGTELLRNVRRLTVDQLAELSDDDLEHAARWLRAAAYSARTGAERLDAERARRTDTPTTEEIPPCLPPPIEPTSPAPSETTNTP